MLKALRCKEPTICVESFDWGTDESCIDYAKIYESRSKALHIAYLNGKARYKSDIDRFCDEQNGWIFEFALFMALKKHFKMKSWTLWDDEEIRLHQKEAIERYKKLLSSDIDFFIFQQFLFFKQWNSFKRYVSKLGIGIIGDIPIYIAMDSVDVWATPENFMLDKHGVPTSVAGVPPDYFTADGQLWGNPIYNWKFMKQNNYDWWVKRIREASKLYDVIRIDHFRAFESYWSVPYGESTAKDGTWEKGPGMDLISVLKAEFPSTEIIAEDLGYLTPAVKNLLQNSGFPGMKVLEFAFDSREPSNYLPHTYVPNCVCYAGTHDNSTIAGWQAEADPEDIEYAVRYLGLNDDEGFVNGIIRGGMSSVANLFVTQFQDYLGLGQEARINIPGTLGINWKWRMQKGCASKQLAKHIAELTSLYGRAPSKK